MNSKDKAEYMKNWRKNNQDKIKEYRLKNKEKALENWHKNKEKYNKQHKEWYYDNKEVIYSKNKRKYAEMQFKISLLKESAPCKDCGQWFPFYVMDYDHLESENKNFTISQSMLRSEESILNEIKKCDLICANCHRIRTYLRKH